MAEIWEQSGTVDPEVRAYVQSLSTVDDTYAVGDDALAALNDILRWLRLYDEKLSRYDVKRCLAEANLLKGDLLEILALWPEELQDNKLKAKLALSCLQLMVPLTWPLELEDEKTTVNHARHMPYLQLAQVGYKRAILQYEHASILRTIVRIGLPAMTVERRDRSARDESIIKLVLYLFRNIAVITQPQMLPSLGDENEISRSATIEAFAEQDVFNLLLTIGSGIGDEFQDQDVILLEILFHLVKGVDPSKLFVPSRQLQSDGAEELRSLMRKEKAMHQGYNKTAPSRHHRFGTMIWVKRDDTKLSTVSGQQGLAGPEATLQQMDASKKWNKPKYRGKVVEASELMEFDVPVNLTEKARALLRNFVADFVDSSFNPLFSSLRKAIEREMERVGDTHQRQYLYLIHWLLRAEASRREQTPPSQGQENAFTHIAAVLDQETFVLINRHMQRALDEKAWHDLQATLMAFTQILLTVQAVAASGDEGDEEIAENIQQRIFYEESTHDRIVQILRGYSNQSFGYLDAVTECAHVFVRMLERYSKQNVDLQIRSKRRVHKKKATNNNADQQQPAGSDEEREAHQTIKERQFDFARFSAKLMSQGCVDTFIKLTGYYNELTPEQLKRCHRYFYRLAFKHDLALLLFRVDILQLFYRMIKSQQPLGGDTSREWEQLIRQIFRQCIKWLTKSDDNWKEMCIVEMLFSKIPGYTHYLQTGEAKVIEKRTPRAPAQVEFKPNVDEEQKIPIAVSLLLEKSQDSLTWLKKELKQAILTKSESGAMIFLVPDNEERKSALFRNKHLRLLLSTIGVERVGEKDDADANWIIPGEISAAKLEGIVKSIERAEFDPPSVETEDVLRNQRARKDVVSSTSPSLSDDEEEGHMFPDNLPDTSQRPTKRRKLEIRTRHSVEEETAKERADERKRREKERRSRIKSALYVTASDDEDDEEADKEFFRLEEERRKRYIKEMGAAAANTVAQEDEGSEEEEIGGRDASRVVGRGGSERGGGVQVEDVDMDAGFEKTASVVGAEDGMEEEEEVQLRPARKRTRAGFLDDSDDDE
ncbi:timeless-domain-containing protein [Piedraia hortae CBS 480.64]|uniref:Topoisomerase 1-associated factor 1 n=1 Tax=Piedraia hortae CBS 480.64 TaxID=1314780 RepID=A0A6A7CAW0_9PEZI|nr:timeless-domain-containing protein [Piedraia hortae CBS 480.64]